MDLTNKEQIEGFLTCMYPVTEENAGRIVRELEGCRTDWLLLANDWNKRDVFAQIYLTLSEAYFIQKNYTKAVDILTEGVQEYGRVCEYSYQVKSQMWHNLGIYQSYLGKEADALQSFRKYIYFLTINNTSYRDISLYCYKKISDYTIADLQKSRITLVDPSEFDDPVDCLVFPWLERNAASVRTEGDKLASKLLEKAFSFVRIKCFVRNAPLPSWKDPKPTSTEKKAEYSNVIMWPTYADYHRGICLEYHLPACLQQPDLANERTFFLKDVDYANKAEIQADINIKEAFFTKSTEWEFEKETRLLYYDTKSTEKFKSVEVPTDSLKKVFFGMRCPEKDMYRVIQALKRNNEVKFYVMCSSQEDVYSFEPHQIDVTRFCELYEHERRSDKKRYLCAVVRRIMAFFTKR